MGGQGLINTYLSSLRLVSVQERWCRLAPLSRTITLVSAQHIAYFYTRNRIVFSPTAAVNYYDSQVENGGEGEAGGGGALPPLHVQLRLGGVAWRTTRKPADLTRSLLHRDCRTGNVDRVRSYAYQHLLLSTFTLACFSV